MQKQQLEFILNCSPKLLYRFITNPSDLALWFANDVTVNNDVFTFKWDDEEQQATITEKKPLDYIIYSWKDRKDEFLQFAIKQDALTNTVSLEVTDFCKEDEMQMHAQLWEIAIQSLREKLGA